MCAALGTGTAFADALHDEVSGQLQRENIQVQNLGELNEPQLRQVQAVLRGGESQREKEDESSALPQPMCRALPTSNSGRRSGWN
jgi:hypothetical protein